MADTCVHLGDLATDSAFPSGPGYSEFTFMERPGCICAAASNAAIGCCDNSPNQRATKHFHGTGTLIQSYEPGEDWL